MPVWIQNPSSIFDTSGSSAQERLARRSSEKTVARRGLAAVGRVRPGSAKQVKRHPDNELVSHFISSVTDLKRKSRLGSAARSTWSSVSLNPSDIRHYKPLLVAPLMIVDGYRRARAAHDGCWSGIMTLLRSDRHFLASVGQLRYLQATFESGALRNPDRHVAKLLSPAQRIRARLDGVFRLRGDSATAFLPLSIRADQVL